MALEMFHAVKRRGSIWHTRAEVMLGQFYWNKGLPEKAISWLESAAKKGEPLAKSMMEEIVAFLAKNPHLSNIKHPR